MMTTAVKFTILMLAVCAVMTGICNARSLQGARENTPDETASPARGKRELPDVAISDEWVKRVESLKRKKYTKTLLNKTDTTYNGRDCAKCFRALTAKNCVCDVTEIIRHMQNTRKEGNRHLAQLHDLPERLQKDVTRRIRMYVARHLKRINKNLQGKNVLLGMIARKRRQQMREKHRRNNIFNDHKMIIF